MQDCVPAIKTDIQLC